MVHHGNQAVRNAADTNIEHIAYKSFSLRAAALFFVDDAASLVTTVLTAGDTVVPETVLTASVVGALRTLPLAAPVETVVAAETVVGSTVVPGMVVVYVTTWPRAVAAIALPLPAAVYWVGMGKVAVLGLSDDWLPL